MPYPPGYGILNIVSRPFLLSSVTDNSVCCLLGKTLLRKGLPQTLSLKLLVLFGEGTSAAQQSAELRLPLIPGTTICPRQKELEVFGKGSGESLSSERLSPVSNTPGCRQPIAAGKGGGTLLQVAAAEFGELEAFVLFEGPADIPLAGEQQQVIISEILDYFGIA